LYNIAVDITSQKAPIPKSVIYHCCELANDGNHGLYKCVCVHVSRCLRKKVKKLKDCITKGTHWPLTSYIAQYNTIRMKQLKLPPSIMKYDHKILKETYFKLILEYVLNKKEYYALLYRYSL